MTCTTWLTAGVLLIAGCGCTSSSGRTYRSTAWKAGQPLGKVLVIVPPFYSYDCNKVPVEKPELRQAIRDAIASLPGTTAVDSSPLAADLKDAASPVSESKAIAVARERNAETVCILTPGDFYGFFSIDLLPPAWQVETKVQYALRVIDVKSGDVLINSVRQRKSGGFFALSASDNATNLREDLKSVLTAGK